VEQEKINRQRILVHTKEWEGLLLGASTQDVSDWNIIGEPESVIWQI
jgi:hypothetical protein